MNEDEAYQRRVDTGEWKPRAMTEDERLTWRRWEASFTFETMWTPKKAHKVPDQSG